MLKTLIVVTQIVGKLSICPRMHILYLHIQIVFILVCYFSPIIQSKWSCGKCGSIVDVAQLLFLPLNLQFITICREIYYYFFLYFSPFKLLVCTWKIIVLGVDMWKITGKYLCVLDLLHYIFSNLWNEFCMSEKKFFILILK